MTATGTQFGSAETLRVVTLARFGVSTFWRALQASNGQFVCAENGGDSTVVANRDRIGTWEVFKMVGDDAGHVTLRTIAASPRYVCAENGGGGDVNANRTVASTWETFTSRPAP